MNFIFEMKYAKFIFLRLRTCCLKKKRGPQPFEPRTTQHGGKEGEQEQVTMCFLETTLCFSPVIERQSVSVVIVRRLCDVCSKINSVTFVTDEQRLSMCPTEPPTNLDPVRIP
jgi:hypothetical protein